MNKKGFTVVELAMVVVIIGALIGLAIKGLSLYDSAKMRREMTRMHDYETALLGFYNFAGAIPAPNSSGSGWLDLEDMISAGFITKENMDSSLVSDQYWGLRYCMDRLENGVSLGWAWAAEPTHICAAMDNTNHLVQRRFICFMESTLDDNSSLHGKGRNPGFGSNYDTDTGREYDNCTYHNPADTSGYAWQVF
jgi:prepilin-type N-terminal cleavage/methylation domain-containing protein